MHTPAKKIIAAKNFVADDGFAFDNLRGNNLCKRSVHIKLFVRGRGELRAAAQHDNPSTARRRTLRHDDFARRARRTPLASGAEKFSQSNYYDAGGFRFSGTVHESRRRQNFDEAHLRHARHRITRHTLRADDCRRCDSLRADNFSARQKIFRSLKFKKPRWLNGAFASVGTL